ncbi:hypothetical protein BDV98DRAFT_145036 [Pterulicium gracile]|uniref:Cora-domain-containing protein n=1 Tax=Pterulicium gracile TaxID=1884261 RepID=A0A5C3QWC3_9AGAR|nr:hypothetical protein BDV98DRAFT_145036 [Pterula gracilis]
MALGRSTSSVRRAACACPSASNTAGDFDGCNLHDDAGDEPGINPANESAHTRYGRIHEKCQIQVTDYSWDHYDTRSFENEDFVQFLSDQKVAFPRESDETPTVRWINVGGVSWDVLSALTMKYDIHSLALEDILRPQDRNSSKCDYFKKCLFVRIVCHTLRPGNNSQERETLEDGSMGSRSDPHIRALTHRWRRWTQHSSSEEALPTSKSSRLRFPGLPSSHSRRLARQRRQLIIEKLRDSAVQVQLAPVFLFLIKGGDTVISIYPASDMKLTKPIAKRLQDPSSGLRTSCDASLLIQSHLDLIIDLTLEIVEEYQDVISEIEKDLLYRPNMSSTKKLHIISADIHHLKRTLEPVQTMVEGLRKHDAERTMAAYFDYDMTKGYRGGKGDLTPNANQPRVGYMSYRTSIYLSDIQDHIEFALRSLDMFAGVTAHLIDFSFNMASYEMNERMKQLTVASIIFLPLTLLTGYFGMNFERMESVQNHSEFFFWMIALPVMGVLIPLFTGTAFWRMLRSFYRRFLLESIVGPSRAVDDP